MTDELERLLARKRDLEGKVRAVQARERAKQKKRDARRALIAGRAVLKAAASDPALSDQIAAVLDRTLDNKRERALFDLAPRPVDATEGQG